MQLSAKSTPVFSRVRVRVIYYFAFTYCWVIVTVFDGRENQGVESNTIR